MAETVGSRVGVGGLRAAAWVAVGAMCAGFDAYEPLLDLLPGYVGFHGEMTVRDHPVTFTVYDGGVGISSAWVAEQIRPISERILDRILEQEPDLQPCRFENHLEIYSVPYEVLNDRRRFNKYTYPGKILALFDTRPEDSRVSAIVLSPQGSGQGRILTHELAHYWYHRFCLEGKDSFPETEAFAVELEDL